MASWVQMLNLHSGSFSTSLPPVQKDIKLRTVSGRKCLFFAPVLFYIYITLSEIIFTRKVQWILYQRKKLCKNHCAAGQIYFSFSHFILSSTRVSKVTILASVTVKIHGKALPYVLCVKIFINRTGM